MKTFIDYLHEARTEYETVLEADPQNPGATYNLGILEQEDNGDYTAACRRYTAYLSVAGSDAVRFDDVVQRLTSLNTLATDLADFDALDDPEMLEACVVPDGI
mgnify:CR=1 FL=1